MSDQRNGNGRIDIKTVALVLTSIAAIASPFVSMAVAQEKIRVQEEVNKSQWTAITGAADLAKKNDAIMPIIQSDIRELKGDIKEILRAVKT